MVQISGGFRSTLEIKNVTKSGWREWVCRLDDIRVKEYSLDVYHLIGPQQCATPVLTSSDSRLLLSCWTEKTYPQSDCKLYLTSDDGQETLLTSPLTYNHITVVDDPEYYRSECSVSIPVSSLEAKAYGVKAWVFPKVAGGIDHGAWTKAKGLIKLTKPKAIITGLCPDGSHVKDGYIKSGTSATCTCTLQDEGKPPGQPVWLLSNGNEVEATIKDIHSAILIVSEPGAVKTYNCLAESHLGQQNFSTPFTPNIAYGPVQVDIQGSTNVPIHLCSSTSPRVTVQCVVNVGDVNPSPNLFLLLNDTVQGQGELQMIDGKYKSNLTFTVGVAGKLSVKCQAANSIFRDQISEAELIYEIEAPPQSAPEIKINNGQPIENGEVVTYNEHVDTLEIKCQALGGFPLINNISLMCVESKFQNGNAISMTVKINRTMNGLSCTCSAQHKTGCYNKIKSFTLNILYPATVTIFTVNDQSKQLEIDAGQKAVMKCFATGNPQLKLTITNSSSLLAHADSTNFLEHKIETAKCEDTGLYECEANNFIGKMQASREKFDLFVRCPITLQNESSDGRFIKTEPEDKIVHFIVDVQGYPAAKDFKLLTKDGQTVSSAFYGASSNLKELFLKLHVDPSKTKEYILHAGNGIGEPLKYEFSVGPQIPQAVSEASSHDKEALIIGLSVALSVLGLITLVLIICCCRRKGYCQRKCCQRESFDIQKRGLDKLYQSKRTAKFPVEYSDFNEDLKVKRVSLFFGGFFCCGCFL